MDISAMDPQGIQQLFDAEVLGPEGESIGTVEQIFADDVTGAPTFLTVEDAATGAETFLPVGGASFDNKNVTVPFSKDVVDAAPTATGGDDLSPDRESEVYRYYGIRAPRRSRAGQGEPSQDWGQDVDADSPQSEQAAAEDEPEQETVPDDATAATELSSEEPEFDPAPEGLDAGGADEFRSLEEADEQQEAAAPGAGADETPVDELPAEETAVIEGGSFPFAATTAGAAVVGAAAGAAVTGTGAEQAAEADDATADAEGLAAADRTSEVQASQEQIDEGEDALATPRADGESPEAAHEDEEPEETAAAAVALAATGLPEGAALRKYTVTEMVTVQVPVTREVICWQDADGSLHELESVPAPDKASVTQKKDAADPANWWFEKSDDAASKDQPQD